MTKSVKKRLAGREGMNRSRLDKEVFIEFNGPRLFEMDKFMATCVSIFVSRYKPPMTQNSKNEISQVIAKLQAERSLLHWT